MKDRIFQQTGASYHIDQCGLHQELSDELQRLSTFRPIAQPVQNLVEAVQAQGPETLYAHGYIARRFQQ